MRDILLFAGAFILGRNMDDTIGVDIEGYLDLRYAAGCCGNTVQMEHTQGFVILCHFTLTLQHMDLN